MYCKECGSPLSEGETVCKVCGATIDEVIEYNTENTEEKETEPEQIFFEKTEGPFNNTAPFNNAAPEKKADSEKASDSVKQSDSEFIWNIYDFPKPKKTEEIDFNWGDGEEQDISDIFKDLDETLTSEFPADADKFFTFNKKNEEFQKLLDKEYERIKELDPDIRDNATILHKMETESLYKKKEQADISPEQSAFDEKDISPSLTQADTDNETDFSEALRNTAESFEEANDINNEKSEVTTDLSEAGPTEQEILEQFESEQEEAKQGLTGHEQSAQQQPVNEQADQESELVPLWFDHEEEAEQEHKKGFIGRFILVLIILILLAEIASLGIRYFMPESAAAEKVTEIQIMIEDTFTRCKDAVAGFFDGFAKNGEEGQDEQADSENEGTIEDPEDTEGQGDNLEDETETPDPNPSGDMASLIASQIDHNKNIKVIRANSDLTYESGRDYRAADINNSKPIENNIWYTTESGETVYYDREIVAALIEFDSQWIDYVNGVNDDVLNITKKDSRAYKNAVAYSKVGKAEETFELLEIGDIRQGEKGFYAWVYEEIKETYKGKTNEKTYKWIYYLEPIEKEMKIVSYYQF